MIGCQRSHRRGLHRDESDLLQGACSECIRRLRCGSQTPQRSGAPGSSTENCLPQSCRLLAIHYGDAQHLNHDAEDFDQWSGLVDLCQSGTAVITFSMIPIARSRVSIAPTRSISSATKISAARPGRLSICQRAPSAAHPDRPGSRRATGRIRQCRQMPSFARKGNTV